MEQLLMAKKARAAKQKSGDHHCILKLCFKTGVLQHLQVWRRAGRGAHVLCINQHHLDWKTFFRSTIIFRPLKPVCRQLLIQHLSQFPLFPAALTSKRSISKMHKSWGCFSHSFKGKPQGKSFLYILSCLHIYISVKELCKSPKLQTWLVMLLLCCSLETQFCFQVQNEMLFSSCTQQPNAPWAFWGAARFLCWERGISSFQSIKSLSTPQSISGYCKQPLRKLKKMWNTTFLATLYVFSCFVR